MYVNIFQNNHKKNNEISQKSDDREKYDINMELFRKYTANLKEVNENIHGNTSTIASEANAAKNCTEKAKKRRNSICHGGHNKMKRNEPKR